MLCRTIQFEQVWKMLPATLPLEVHGSVKGFDALWKKGNPLTLFTLFAQINLTMLKANLVKANLENTILGKLLSPDN